MRASATALVALAASAACEATPPSGFERALAASVKRRVTVGGRAEANPLPDTAEVAAEGERAFGSYCGVCHGVDGRATDVPFAAAMSPPVPSLASPDVQAYTDGQLHRIIERGLWPSGMPAARGLLHDEEIWEIVRWLRHLPPEGRPPEPVAEPPSETSPPPPRSGRARGPGGG